MKNNTKNLQEWERNYLEIVSPEKKSHLFYYLKFLNSKNFKKIEGDIVEAGVFRGTSLISSALLLKKNKQLNIKKIWGYDTFSGFPSYSEFDSFKQFDKMFKTKKISRDHYKNIQKLKKYHKIFKTTNIKANNISSSNNFNKTSLSYIKKKITFFNLSSRINLVKGDFKYTLKKKQNLPKNISAGIIDCDLYEGYKITLQSFWPRLSINGKLFLDEYYSLKFPGPRIAVNNFIKKTKNALLVKDGVTGNFERWSIKKIGRN